MARGPWIFCGCLLIACSSSSDSGGGSPATGGASAMSGTGGSPSESEAGGDTWSNFAQTFFAKYCVSCHDGQAGINGDFRNLSDVTAHEADIRCGIATSVLHGCDQSRYPPRQFPIGTGPKPTDAERTRVVAWIDAGLPM